MHLHTCIILLSLQATSYSNIIKVIPFFPTPQFLKFFFAQQTTATIEKFRTTLKVFSSDIIDSDGFETAVDAGHFVY